MEVSMIQVLQLLGAVLILIPFAWSQLGTLSLSSARYLGLNLAGSALLAAVALAETQWGFVLLEFCWAVVAGWQLLSRTARQGAT
jgi:hypothetical protein